MIPQKRKGLLGFWDSLMPLGKIVVVVILFSIFASAAYLISPGIRVQVAQTLSSISVDETEINNESTDTLAQLPTSKKASVNKPLNRLVGYAWNGQMALITANGGPRTTEGSFMQQNNVNLEIIRKDWLTDIRASMMKFVEEFDKGSEYPQSDMSANFGIVMGDGIPFVLSTTQDYLDATYGKDKYHIVVVGAIGMSNGEDKVIAPVEFKTNPKMMLGSVVSVVVGDGDWVTLLNYCFANGLKVNPDFTTYDAQAVNIHPSENDDYINSAKELIASQLNGFTVERDEVVEGKKTGKKVKVPINVCATWTPGDKIVFDALTGYTDIASTKDYPNQMATTIFTIKEWADKHPEDVIAILKSTYQAANQIKKYDEWKKFGAAAVASTFQLENADYWYKMFNGETLTKAGVQYSIGGSKVLNYSDALQYYGITDGVNRYKSVYTAVSNYLTGMNPFNFNSSVSEIVPYENAVDLKYLKSIQDVETSPVEKIDYSSQRTEVMASGEWHINYATGSAVIDPSSYDELETVYNLLIQAEDTKVTLVGHTDNTGNNSINIPLSRDRAQSVADYLKQKGVVASRIQFVDGKGSDEPIADNTTAQGKAKNRRVQITLLK